MVCLCFYCISWPTHFFGHSSPFPLPPPLPPCFWVIQPVQSYARHHPWPLLQKIILVIPPSSSPSHSPDLGCVGAQRIMFLGRFLVQLKHLLSGGPRLARMWLILDLARNRCLDSENQGTIGNSLWWSIYSLNGNNSQGAWTPQSLPSITINHASFSTSITPSSSPGNFSPHHRTFSHHLRFPHPMPFLLCHTHLVFVWFYLP